MSKKQGLTIGTIRFDSQKKAIAFCSEMLGRYDDDQTVNDEKDSQFLLALVRRHPDNADKIGPGVKRFFRDVAPRPSYGNSCFWIERVDGTKIDFSFKSGVTGKEK